MSTTAKIQAQIAKYQILVAAGCRRYILPLLDAEAKLEEQTMYKINVRNVHIDIQKQLAFRLTGKLVNGILTVSQNPEDVNWEEIEISIYGSIDADADRLTQLISWEDEDKENPLLKEVEKNFAYLSDWDKYACPGYKAAIIGASSLEEAVGSVVNNLPRKYWGQRFSPTGRTKEVSIPSLVEGDGMRNNNRYEYDYDIRYEYCHKDGTTVWAGGDFTHIWSEKEVLKYIQKWVYEFLQRENMTWDGFVKSIERQRMLNEQYDIQRKEEAAKKAAAVPVPDWFEKIKRNASKQRFWVGDDYVVSYFWNPEMGQVVESMDDRRNGLNAVDRYKSKELGSDEAAVLAQIELRLGEKEAKMAAKTSILNAYEAYVLDRQKRSLPVKSFEKWAAK
jgi:hypothetical protein